MQTISYMVFLPVFVAFFLAVPLKQKISDLLPIVYIGAVVWILIFGVFDKLQLGVNLLIPLALLIVISIGFLKQKNIFTKKNIHLFFHPSVFLFMTFSIWMFDHSRQMRFKDWDEFSYWGTAVKGLFYYDSIGPFTPIEMSFPEYIPGLPLLSYITTQANGSWKESFVFWTYQIFILSLIFSLSEKLSWRRGKSLVISVLILLLTATIFFYSFQSVYADAILGILFGLLLVLASSKKIIENKTYLINFGFITFYISLIKDIGIYFSLLGSVVLIVNFYLNGKKSKSKLLKQTKWVIVTGAIFSPVIIFKIIWGSILQANELATSRSLPTLIADLLLNKNSLSLIPESQNIISNFVTRTTTGPITSINGFSLTAIHWLIIFSVLLILASFGRNLSLRPAIVVTIVFGFIGYLLALLFSYLTVFTTSEALGLASFERYVSIYLVGVFVFLSFLFVDSLEHFDKQVNLNVFSMVWICFLLLQSTPANLLSYVRNPNGASDQIREAFSAQSWLISEMNLNKGDRVWIIAQHTVGFEFFLFQYELLPAEVGKIPWSIGSTYGPGDIWTDPKITPEKWSAALNDFDYVLISNTTESFIKEFGYLFDSTAELDRPGFYKVEKLAESIQLTRVR